MTLGDHFKRTSHAKVYRGRDEIRSLLRYAAGLKAKKKISVDGVKLEVTDVDLILFTSGNTPIKRFIDLLLVACEPEIAITRFHFVVKDEKAGKKGYISYFLPHAIGMRQKPEAEKGAPHTYRLNLYFQEGKGLAYRLRCRAAGVDKSMESLEALGKALDALREREPKAVIQAGLNAWFGNEVKGPKVPRMQDLVDFFTLAVTKGANLTPLVNKVYPRRRK